MIWALSGGIDAERHAAELARIPLGRLGGAEEIARAVRFLLSDDAAYITGAIVRSEESRVGKEWVSTVRSRRSPYHYKKQTHDHTAHMLVCYVLMTNQQQHI